jgi:SAM-dependent methyltransferase
MGLKNKIKNIPGIISLYDFTLRIGSFFGSFFTVFIFFKQYSKFKSLKGGERFKLNWSYKSAITFEKTVMTEFDRHYIYHTAWAARCLAETKPIKHIDISSSLYLSGICSAFMDIEFYDFRPADLQLSNLKCESANLTNLHFEANSINSLSCMHTVEHIGLGRYGDTLDVDGDLKAISELIRVLAPGGNLFFVVPVGEPTIQFNAHRIYSRDQILSYFKELKLEKFTLIGEQFSQGGLIDNPSNELLQKQKYGCGCFWFKKI